ncbi:MAG TPA: cellulase family glycosylhydrolase [Ktedonobacteraceae bacterium]|jgi:hypothetical protein|nr:cellulase family glycosylhydrolase [Ktedonobacteraceae bacterium]HLI69732.1 cellulase family glycosylhydrolase [Ktedonobacteraceae bacterium]
MKRKRSLMLLGLVVILTGAAVSFVWRAPTPVAHAAVSNSGLHVSGNQLLNGAGQPVRPLGVDRAGSEYMCDASGDNTVFDDGTNPNSAGQTGAALDAAFNAATIPAFQSWDIQAVRLPLNEDCWLGINGYPAAQYTAATYQQTIVNYVNLLTSNNFIVILDLHWSAPGTTQSNKQLAMPDLDHAPAFWTSVANTFKSNSSVIFDLFNEPFPGFNGASTTGWSCWLNGSTAASTAPCSDIPFAVAGMQTLVNTVRATGATNVLMLGGLAYANDLSQWLQYEPTDPDNNLAASFHLYNGNSCNYVNCWVETVAPVAAKVPVIAGEIGEGDCGESFIDMAMNWLDSEGIGYLAWAWDTYNCWSFPALISDYSGTPTAYGQGFKTHLYDLANGITPTPTPTPVPGHYCQVHYGVSSWTGAFTVNITITNISSSPIVGWTLQFTFGSDQQVTAGWNATWSQQGQVVTARDVGYNDTIAAGASTGLGFNGTWTTSNPTPTAFTLNGTACVVS